MGNDQDPGGWVWRWVAAPHRCHLALTHRRTDGVVSVALDPRQPHRFYTRCALGPFEGAKLRHVGALSPSECAICMELWSATMATLDDADRGRRP